MSGRESGADRLDVVIPAYNESLDALTTTVAQLRRQTHSVARITIVDDASEPPIALPEPEARDVRVLRMTTNGGISAARNAGVRASDAPFVACVNVEVLPEPDWVERCLGYMRERPRVGVVCARTRPLAENTVFGRWRLKVQERRYPEVSGPIDWVAGHAMLFRREALVGVGGFDERLQRAGEDVEISARLRSHGWEVHCVAETSCRSIQDDSLATFANAEYNRFCWRAQRGNGFLRCASILTSRGLVRSAIHLVRLDWALLPVEVGVWLRGMGIAWRKR